MPGQFDPYPSLNQTQWYRALLHPVSLTPFLQLNLVVQSSSTPDQFDPYSSLNQTWWYRALLHEVSLPLPSFN